MLTGILRPADLYHALAARVERALPLDSLLVSRVDGDSAVLVHGRGDTAGGEARRGPTYGAADCVAIRDRRPVLHLPGDSAAACQASGVDSRGRPAISAPVLREGRVLGVLTALGPKGTVYDTADLEFLAAAAGLLAPSMTPAAGGTSGQLEAIDGIIRSIASAGAGDPLEAIARTALESTGADGVAIWLVRTGGDVEAAHSAGPLAPKRGERLALSHDLFRDLAARRGPIPFDNRTEQADNSDDFRRMTRGAGGFVLPLHAQDRVLGAVVACFREGEPKLAPPAVASLERLAALAAVAAGYTRLNDQIGALSLIDPLTGIPNQRQLAMYLEKEFAAARRGRRLTVLLFDIDDFDRYNRASGRQAGDEVLRAFAETLVQQTRAMNLAARYDGDSFIVALADADRRAGFIHASRIARAAEAHPLVGPSGIHASVGISSYAPRMKSFEDMIQAAVKDLEVRRTGGGRLTI